MDFRELWAILMPILTIGTPIAGAWALVQRKTDEHETRLKEQEQRLTAAAQERASMDKTISRLLTINEDRGARLAGLEASKVMLDVEIATLRTGIAVLQSKHDDHDARIERFSAEIAALERRVLEHIDRLFDRLVGRSGGRLNG